jgi:hypothetical protein
MSANACDYSCVSQAYKPELDQSRELDAKQEQYYQRLIGVLR